MQPASQSLEPHPWDLSEFYASESDWMNEVAALQKVIPELSRLESKMRQSPQSLLSVLAATRDLRMRAGKMTIFGTLQSSVDPGNATATHHLDVAQRLEAEVESAASGVWIELAAIGPDRFQAMVAKEPRLAKFTRIAQRVFTMAPHYNPGAEALIKRAARWPSTCFDAYSQLTNELPWPAVRAENGVDVAADSNNLAVARASGSPKLKDTLTKAHFEALKKFEDTFGLLLARRIEADDVLANAEGFSRGIDARLFLLDGFSPAVVEAFTKAAHNNLDTLQRYIKLRSKALGEDRVSYSSLAAGLPLQKTYTIAECRNIAKDLAEPFGPTFEAAMLGRLDGKYLYLPPVSSQTFGIWYPVGGVGPYGIIDFRGTYRAARRYVGAGFLSMAYLDVLKDRIPDSRVDPPVLSNVILDGMRNVFDDYCIAHESSKNAKIALICFVMDNQLNFFNEVLLDELESKIQQLGAAGNTPTGAQISQMYLDLKREYYGSACSIDDLYRSEWMDEDLLFMSSEMQFWPVSFAGAAQMDEWYWGKDPRFFRGFDIIKTSPSDFSADALKSLGLDMTQQAPYEAAISRMNKLCDELEALLK